MSAAFAKLLKDAPRTKLIVSVSDNDVIVSGFEQERWASNELS